jgi:hypothetical protein
MIIADVIESYSSGSFRKLTFKDGDKMYVLNLEW